MEVLAEAAVEGWVAVERLVAAAAAIEACKVHTEPQVGKALDPGQEQSCIVTGKVRSNRLVRSVLAVQVELFHSNGASRPVWQNTKAEADNWYRRGCCTLQSTLPSSFRTWLEHEQVSRSTATSRPSFRHAF